MKVKKILLVLVLLLMVGCTDKPEVNENTDFNIVTSFYPVYVFTENIVKDVPNVKVTNMTSNHTGCLHNYNLTTSDMKLIDTADAFVINGAGLESFLEKAYSAREELNVIDSSKNIELIQEKFSHGDNEHIWLSISDAILQVKNICEGLIKLDSKHTDLYTKNTDEYINKLELLRNNLREDLYGSDNIKLVTSHDAFPYFAEDFGFEIVAVIEREEGASPTSKEISEIINTIKEEEIKAVFIEEDTSSKIAETIANESGAKVYVLDIITSGNGNMDDYENRMKENIKVIKESL